MFTRILVPTDFTEPSDAALNYAREMADKFGTSMHLLHVIEPGNAAGAYEVLAQEARSKFAERVLPLGARYSITTDVVTGSIATTIVAYAASRHIDLIVMGTNGRAGLAQLMMGSVAEHVVRTALCPVLTARQAQAPDGATVSRSARTSQSDTEPGRG